MKQNLNWFLLGAFVSFMACLFLNQCSSKPEPIYKTIKRDSLVKKTDTLKVEVVKLKDAKTKIVYRTKFDTITIEKVLVELQKCDTIVKIDSVIIAKQDTIILTQEEIISDLDSHNQVLESEVKKQKRKLIFTKILAGAIIVVTLLLSTR